MKKKVIDVPRAIPLPYSPAVKAGDYIFVSGQVGHIDEKGNNVTGIDAQTRQCMSNIKSILGKADATLEDVVKVTVFLGSAADFGVMNDIYKIYFPSEPPARSTVVAGFPIPRMLVEIECIAYKPEK